MYASVQAPNGPAYHAQPQPAHPQQAAQPQPLPPPIPSRVPPPLASPTDIIQQQQTQPLPSAHAHTADPLPQPNPTHHSAPTPVEVPTPAHQPPTVRFGHGHQCTVDANPACSSVLLHNAAPLYSQACLDMGCMHATVNQQALHSADFQGKAGPLLQCSV